MDQRKLEVMLVSAKDLKKVKWVYAIISLSTEPRRTKQRTPVDREGGRNPTWNHTASFTVPADPQHAGQLFLHVALRATHFLRDRHIGDVRVPIKELLAGCDVECPEQEQYISYEIRRSNSGKPKGVLTFSYKLGERVAQAPTPAGQTPQPASGYPPAVVVPYPCPLPQQAHHGEPRSDETVMAYPVGTSPAGTAAPYPGYSLAPGAYPGYQHPPPYGYGPPPHQGYAYHPAVGYGYGPAPVMQPVPQLQQKRRSRLRIGARKF